LSLVHGSLDICVGIVRLCESRIPFTSPALRCIPTTTHIRRTGVRAKSVDRVAQSLNPLGLQRDMISDTLLHRSIFPQLLSKHRFFHVLDAAMQEKRA